MYIKTESVIKCLTQLQNAPFHYIILRNTEGELPSRLAPFKDIDLLIKKSDRSQALDYFHKLGYHLIIHPWSKVTKDVGVTEFDFLKNDENLILDINYELVFCNFERSKFQLHSEFLQNEIWKSSRILSIGGVEINYIGCELEFIISAARCIIDKRKMTAWNFSRLCYLYNSIGNIKTVETALQVIFKDRFTEVINVFEVGVWDDSVILET